MSERKLPVLWAALGESTLREETLRCQYTSEDRKSTEAVAFACKLEVVEYIPRAQANEDRWLPLSELKGESRYILVAHKDYHASRVYHNSRARISIQQLCFKQAGYEPTHFCELPEFDDTAAKRKARGK
jgi:hypothetical protein